MPKDRGTVMPGMISFDSYRLYTAPKRPDCPSGSAPVVPWLFPGRFRVTVTSRSGQPLPHRSEGPGQRHAHTKRRRRRPPSCSGSGQALLCLTPRDDASCRAARCRVRKNPVKPRGNGTPLRVQPRVYGRKVQAESRLARAGREFRVHLQRDFVRIHPFREQHAEACDAPRRRGPRHGTAGRRDPGHPSREPSIPAGSSGESIPAAGPLIGLASNGLPE